MERNRSRFIAVAVQNELARRRREELLHSLRNPHPDAAELAEVGLADWATSLPSGDEGLVDSATGTRASEDFVRSHRPPALRRQAPHPPCVWMRQEGRARGGRPGTRAVPRPCYRRVRMTEISFQRRIPLRRSNVAGRKSGSKSTKRCERP
jgi:hypothetical protein